MSQSKKKSAGMLSLPPAFSFISSAFLVNKLGGQDHLLRLHGVFHSFLEALRSDLFKRDGDIVVAPAARLAGQALLQFV